MYLQIFLLIDYPIYLNVREGSEPYKNIHFLNKSLI